MADGIERLSPQAKLLLLEQIQARANECANRLLSIPVEQRGNWLADQARLLVSQYAQLDSIAIAFNFGMQFAQALESLTHEVRSVPIETTK